MSPSHEVDWRWLTGGILISTKSLARSAYAGNRLSSNAQRHPEAHPEKKRGLWTTVRVGMLTREG